MQLSDSPSTSPEIMGQDGDGLEGEAGAPGSAKLYPSDDLLRLQHASMQLKACHYGALAFLHALEAAWSILRAAPQGLRQADLTQVRQFMRRDGHEALERLMTFHIMQHREACDDAFEALQLVAMCMAKLLELRLLPGSVINAQDFDTDLSPLLAALMRSFDASKPLHRSMEYHAVPLDRVAKYPQLAALQQAGRLRGWVAAQPDTTLQDADMGAAAAIEPFYSKACYAQYVNTFGGLNGFTYMLQLAQHPESVSFPVLNSMLAVMAQVVEDATPEAFSLFEQAMPPVLDHVQELIAADSDRLSDHGNDRTFQNFGFLLTINLPRIVEHMAGDHTDLLQRFLDVRCAYVVKRLQSSSFTKLLSGAKECHRILESASSSKKGARAVPTLESLLQWMHDESIVQHLLRSGLHHAQYVQEVRGIMQVLTECGYLLPEHVDLMWAAIEKEDTYDAVKTHMFDVLADIAAGSQPAQLDMLFAKLDTHQARSVQDTQRLLSLLDKLAASDNESKMRGKLLSLVWGLTMSADAPRELLSTGAYAGAVRQYMSKLEYPDTARLCSAELHRCVKAIKSSADSDEWGLVPLLHTLVALLDELSTRGEKSPRQAAVDRLQHQHRVFDLLTQLVCDRVEMARQAVVAAGGQQPRGQLADATVQQVTAGLGQGVWSYQDVLCYLLDALLHLAQAYSDYFDESLMLQLWQALLIDPPCEEDWLPAVQHFWRLGLSGLKRARAPDPFIATESKELLLKPPYDQHDYAHAPPTTANLLWLAFVDVNCPQGEERLVQGQPPITLVPARLKQVLGLDLLWRLYFSTEREDVAHTLRRYLLGLYHCQSQDNRSSGRMRRHLVKSVVEKLLLADDALSAGGAEAELAQRHIARCLAIARQSVVSTEDKYNTPPVPAHNLAWRGAPLAIEVAQPGNTRQRALTHTNEYVGLLRARLARQMGVGPQHVRLILLGQELREDAKPISTCNMRARAVVNVVASPEANRDRLAPADNKDLYEQCSCAWLLMRTECVHALLLKFVDAPGMPASITSDAMALLALLPTQPSLTQRLVAALDSADKQQQLTAVLSSSADDMALDAACGPEQQGGAQPQRGGPYHALYALQALAAVLFPTFDGAADEGGAAAQGSACPSPAGGAPASPAGTAQQQVPRSEQQQQDFLQHQGLTAVLAAAKAITSSSPGDLKLQRQVSELLVVLLHNLLDAVVAWNVPLEHMPAVAGGSGSHDMQHSGAESGAGQAAGAAAAAPRGGVSSITLPGDSCVEAMAGVQVAGDEHGTAACSGVVAAAGDSDEGTTPAATADTTHHHPTSPLADVSSPGAALPEQQQQQAQGQGSKQPRQRLRAGELPPLPPHAAHQQGGSHQSAAPSVAAVLGEQALLLMAHALLQVAVDTSQLWGSMDPGAPQLDDDSSKDVAVARDALQVLLRLLEHPPVLQALLLDVREPALITVVLLNPFYTPLRRQAAELLERLVHCDARRARLLPWLLTQLNAARAHAHQHPASSAEFYALLSHSLMQLTCSSTQLPSALFSLASDMLDEEVAALKALAAGASPGTAGSPSSSQQQHAAPRRLPPPQQQQQQQQQGSAFDDADPAGVGMGDDSEEPAACVLLQGRLQLVLALVRVLDRRDIGSEGHGGLIKLLLQDLLCPEAVQQLASAAGRLDLQRCGACLEPPCATRGCRKAALELLSELMGESPASLEEGVALLLELHYTRQVVNGFNQLARALRPSGHYAGLRNGGATCYMNSVFQQLFMQPSIRARILGAAEVPASERADSVFAQLQGMFAVMALGKATFLSPRDFWNAFKDYDGTPIDVREHQDAYEFFTRLQDLVDQHLISSKQQPAIKHTMGGTFVQQIICRGHDFTSERNEDFYGISVEVKGMGTLQKSLDDYVKGELMEGDNAYLCEELGKRVPAVKRIAIRQLPQMLCIHLKRFEFDYNTQTRHKLRDRFEFPLELDMFPYTAEGLAAADALKAAEEQHLAAQQQQQQQQDADDSGQQQQQRRVVRTSSSGGSGAAAAALTAGSDGGKHMYDLYGVIVHCGSAFTGHYYSYIRERPGSSASGSASSQGARSAAAGARWYCFDDKDVYSWDVAHLESECFGGKASQDYVRTRARAPETERAHSAYMLFYERRAAPPADAAPAPQQQQQAAGGAEQPAAAAAAAGGDADMAGAAEEAPSSPALQEVAGSNGNGSSSGSGGGACGGAGVGSIPYGMPPALYQHVMEQNINIMWLRHVLDKDYFRFVRQLVDSRGDLGQLAARKARRRDPLGVVQQTPPSAGSSGSRMQVDRARAAGAATPPHAQQPQQQLPQPGSAAPLPMSISPRPSATAAPAQLDLAAAAAAAAAAVAADGVAPRAGAASSTNPPTPEPQASPGPSSRRGEEAEAVAVCLMRLGVLFQFQVHLRAHESLRSEHSVWYEALTSLMSSGPTSSACMQVFLEAQAFHPDWLRTYLLDCDGQGPNCPRAWATALLSDAISAATVRCNRALQQFFATFAMQQLQLGPDSNRALHAAPRLEETLTQQCLPPLGQALLGFVGELVALVRSCLPRWSAEQQVTNALQVPTEPAAVLLKYATSTPWAAAHLLQVINLAPDLADLMTCAVMAELVDDDLITEELAPLAELLCEMLCIASNLPQLAAEHAGYPGAAPNRHLVQLPGGPDGSGGGGAPAAAAAAAHAGGHASAILPAAGFVKLVSPEMMRALVQLAAAGNHKSVTLGGLLTYNGSFLTARELCNHAVLKIINELPQASPQAQQEQAWALSAISLSLMVLQPDMWCRQRMHRWLLGSFCLPGEQPQQQDAADCGAGVLNAAAASTSWQAVFAFRLVRQVIYSLHHRGRSYADMEPVRTALAAQLLSSLQVWRPPLHAMQSLLQGYAHNLRGTNAPLYVPLLRAVEDLRLFDQDAMLLVQRYVSESQPHLVPHLQQMLLQQQQQQQQHAGGGLVQQLSSSDGGGDDQEPGPAHALDDGHAHGAGAGAALAGQASEESMDAATADEDDPVDDEHQQQGAGLADASEEEGGEADEGEGEEQQQPADDGPEGEEEEGDDSGDAGGAGRGGDESLALPLDASPSL